MGGAPSFVIMGRRCVAITRFMNKKIDSRSISSKLSIYVDITIKL